MNLVEAMTHAVDLALAPHIERCCENPKPQYVEWGDDLDIHFCANCRQLLDVEPVEPQEPYDAWTGFVSGEVMGLEKL